MARETQKIDIDESHPFRFMFKLAVFVGLIYFAGRFVAQKKNEYSGLTESQARDKIVEKMSQRVGDGTASDLADQIIPKLKDRGIIKSDPPEEAGELADAADEIAGEVEEADETADKVTEAVDSVVKD